MKPAESRKPSRAVRSHAGLGELEAALTTLMARHGRAVALDLPCEEKLWREVMALQQRIDSERCHSPNITLNEPES